MCNKSAGVFFLFFISVFTGCRQKQKVDFILYGGQIYTADSLFSIQTAMAIASGKIVATGTDAAILDRYEAAHTQNIKGRFVYPGFIDAHCHFTGYATDLWKCDVTGTHSFNEAVDRLKKYAATAKTQWLYARGWDQNDWAVKEFPDKRLLDSLFPGTPVFMKRIDGHAVLVNQRALDIAGITAFTRIDGGMIEVKQGKLTGILFDRAMDAVENKIPTVSDDLARKFFMQVQDSCFQYGITGVHDCGISEHTLELIDGAQKSGALQMKIFALLTDSLHYIPKWVQKGPYKTPMLHMGGFKIYADGALGSRGACLLQPYTDKPGWNGLLLTPPAQLNTVAQTLAASQLQMCTHAIGDSACRLILKLYGTVLKEKNDRRWRIEHAQVINDNDFTLFNTYSIIPSVQPVHATSDMYWAAGRLGAERTNNAYAYKKLLQQNGWIALGTDFPVEDINPFKTLYAATQRKDVKGYPPDGFQKENALTGREALWGMTLWAAKAAFEEKEKGSIEPGKAADFFICGKDIFTINAGEVPQMRAQETFVNGKKVFPR